MAQHDPETDWRVWLIAGPSAAGKSTAARAIGKRLRISVLEADELRLALQRVTTPRSQPALHRFLDPLADVWFDADAYAEALRQVAETVSRALEPVIEHRCDQVGADRLIIEGDGVLPSLVQHRPGVRAALVVERDRDVLRSRMAERRRGFDKLPREAQTTSVTGSVKFGIMLEEIARAHRVPVVDAAPLGTLVDRILRTAADDD